ncbi:MAG TPA: SWIM zinc finger family protein [Longimicrobium sp.]|nr:SWIM zinc finger family protein [Longimicrobium sp.]
MPEMIDIEAAGGVESGRLERGVTLVAECIGRGRYRVHGGAEEHFVDLSTPNTPRCDCGDHLWRDRVCKHILAALLREGDAEVIAAVGGLVRDLRAAATPEKPPRRRRTRAAEPADTP